MSIHVRSRPYRCHLALLDGMEAANRSTTPESAFSWSSPTHRKPLPPTAERNLGQFRSADTIAEAS